MADVAEADHPRAGGASRPPRRADASSGALALVALAAAVLGGRLAAGDLVGDPVIYAALAKAVVQRGDWGTLYLAGQPFFDKPPLGIWMAAASFALLGVATWSARLPGVLCSLGCCLLTARLGARLAGPAAGLVAGTVLALTPGFVRFGSTLLLDPPFILFTLAAFVVAVDAWARDGAGLWLAGAFLGAAFLAKGTQTLVAPAILTLAWLASGRDARPPFRALVAAGAAFLAVALPWHVYELWRWDGAFVRGAVYDVSEKLAGRPPFVSYFRALAVTTLPWLPVALLGMWRAARERRGGFAVRLLVVWTGIAYGVLFVAGKYSPRYFMLLHPALALWAALGVAPWLPEPARVVHAVGAAAVAAWAVVALWPGRVHPSGVREAVVALAATLPPRPEPIHGFRLRHEGTRARFAYYLDRDVDTSDDPDALARLAPGTPIVAALRDADALTADSRFRPAARTRDFAAFLVRAPEPGSPR